MDNITISERRVITEMISHRITNKKVDKALVLAAGLGTRLAPITDNKPKALVQVNGKPIIMKQIENLIENGITDITIVSGYKADVLERAIHANYPEINMIESIEFATTNNMYSAYLGLRAMFPDGNMAPFYMMNADVYFDSSVITAIKKDTRKNLIVVDYGRYIEESMKVMEKDGKLMAISKQISSKDALGCSIDVYRFAKDGGQAFYDKCVEYIENKNILNKWSEVALNDVMKKVDFYACPIKGRWLEIDNYDDLKAAEKLFSL